MHMSERSVVRLICGVLFCGALAAASLIFVAGAEAQQPDAPKTGGAPPNSGGTPAPAGDLKSTLGRAPKDIPLIDPCKSAHPPSYCNAKD
jgi:hypothetical protein